MIINSKATFHEMTLHLDVCTQRKPPTLALLMTIIWIMTVLMYSKTTEQNRAHRPACKIDPDTRLPDKIFARLSLDDKRTWSRLGSDARHMILATSKAGRHSDSSPSSSVGVYMKVYFYVVYY